MNIFFIIVYIWLTLIFIWYGRHIKSSVIDRPLILSSTVFTLIFELIALIWICVSIYLLFKNWRLPVFTFLSVSLLKIFLGNIAEFLENIALAPISYLYRALEDWAEKKYKK